MQKNAAVLLCFTIYAATLIGAPKHVPGGARAETTESALGKAAIACRNALRELGMLNDSKGVDETQTGAFLEQRYLFTENGIYRIDGTGLREDGFDYGILFSNKKYCAEVPETKEMLMVERESLMSWKFRRACGASEANGCEKLPVVAVGADDLQGISSVLIAYLNNSIRGLPHLYEKMQDFQKAKPKDPHYKEVLDKAGWPAKIDETLTKALAPCHTPALKANGVDPKTLTGALDYMRERLNKK